MTREVKRKPAPTNYQNLRTGIVKGLARFYGIEVSEVEVVHTDGSVGAYNGPAILIKKGLSAEHGLFLIAHLFGHCVQWCSGTIEHSDIVEKLADASDFSKLPVESIGILKSYESQAAGYSICLLDELFGSGLAQWFSDWAAADWEYFTHISSKMERGGLHNFKLRKGSPVLKSIEIPRFEIRKFEMKYAY